MNASDNGPPAAGRRPRRLHADDGTAALSTGQPGNPAAPAAWQATLHTDPEDIDPAAWDDLLAVNPAPTPFMRHAYLAALHRSGSATGATGWTPVFFTVQAGGTGALQAAAALYLKTHSYGEYVFDWAWADAYQRAGLRYYPKLLGAVPFTPVPGSRLLARTQAARTALLQALTGWSREQGLSSAHLLFIDPADQAAAAAAGWLLREGVQFHWHNRPDAPYADFADFLASLTRDKRKKIQQERRYVREAGIAFDVRGGRDITATDWDFFYRCYVRTYEEHRSTPYLTRAFFAEMAATMPEHWLLFIARQGTTPVAASLLALDPGQRVAYGRYWGALAHVPHLHFSACYYEPLDWCIRQGWLRFEGGAQGEHKMARGLLPVRTASAHWLAHPAFNDAVAKFLAQEGRGMADYLDELNERSPFKAGPASS